MTYSAPRLAGGMAAVLLVACLTVLLHPTSELQAASATWAGGTGAQNWADGPNWNPAAAAGATTGFTNADVATFNTATAGTVIAIDAGRNLRSLTFDTNAGVYTIGGAGVNAGPSLLLNSGGAITLAGTLLGTNTQTFNAPLVLQAATATTAGAYSFLNNTVAVTGSVLKIAGDVSGGTTTNGITLTLGGTGGGTSITAANIVSGVISNGTAALGMAVTKTGGGSWALTGLNTYTGATTMGGGNLYLNTITDAGVPSSIGMGSSLVLNSGTVTYTGTTTSSNRTITGTGATITIVSAATTLTFSSNISNANMTARGAGTLALTGLISGTGSVSRTDGGNFILTNAGNNFTGNVSISTGTITADSIADKGVASAIGAGSFLFFGQTNSAPVGIFQFTGAAGGSTNRDLIIRNTTPTGTGVAGATINNTVAGQTLTLRGGVSAYNTTELAALTLGGAGDGVVSGNIGGTRTTAGAALDLNAAISMSLTKSGAGKWTLSGTNNYRGLTTISQGILNIQNDTALGTTDAGTVLANATTLQMQGGIAVGAETLSIRGTGAAGQSGALVNVSGVNTIGGQVTLAAATTISSDSGTLNLANAAAISGATFGLTLAGAGNGSIAGGIATTTGGLIKNGPGNWTIGGTSTYTGATVINAGTLTLAGTLGATTVTVSSGATLAGAGSIGGVVTIQNGGTLSVGGATPGTLTVNGLTLNPSSSTSFDLGTLSDRVTVNGNLTLAGTINIGAATGFAAGTYTLFDYTGALTNNGVNFGLAPAGYNFTLNTATTGQVNVVTDQTNFQFWNGSTFAPNNVINGGDGTWNNSATNWTNAGGNASSAWGSGMVAVFGGAAGTVGVAENVTVAGLQFTTDGYSVTNAGGNVNISTAAAEVRVDPAVTATISAAITGSGGIDKTGAGTVVLAGANSYAGATAISQGTLRIAAVNALPTTTRVTVGRVGQVSSPRLEVNNNQTVASVTISGIGTNQIIIADGQTLTVNGADGVSSAVTGSSTNNVFRVGGNNFASFGTTTAIVSGNGTLNIDNAAANFAMDNVNISAGPGTAGNALSALDLSGLNTFNARVAQFRVGFGQGSQAQLKLAQNNTITATVLSVGNSNGLNAGGTAGANSSAVPDHSTMLLGQNNTLRISTFNIASGPNKTSASVSFAPGLTAPKFTITGAAGGASKTDLNIATFTIGTGASIIGSLTLNGASADSSAQFGNVIIGSGAASGSTGNATGTLEFDNGSITADLVRLGVSVLGNTGNNTSTGTLNVKGGSLAVAGNIIMGTRGSVAQNASGVVNLTGGVVTVGGDITVGGGVGTVNLNGGALDMTGHNIGTAALPVANLILAAGRLSNVAEINGGGNVTKTTNGALVLTGTNTYSGATTVSGGTLQVGLGGAGSVSSVANMSVGIAGGSIGIGGNAPTLAGSGIIGSAVLIGTGSTIGMIKPGDAAGSLNGTLTLQASLTVANGSQMQLGVTRATLNDSLYLSGYGTTYANAAAYFTAMNPAWNAAPGSTTDHDRITISSSLSIGTGSVGGQVLILDNGYLSGASGGDVFNLLDWDTVADDLSNGFTITNTFSSGGANGDLMLPSLSNGYLWDTSLFISQGILVVIPEPTRMLLLMLGLGALMFRRRRR